MTNEEIIEEIIDLDVDIERQFRQIENIYRDIKKDMTRRDDWLKTLRTND